MIEIMKASAGSGKTFNLAKNYIHILLKNMGIWDAYRHILAVTFTNKATDEMKTRILRELYTLSVNPEKSDFSKFFLPGEEQMDEPAICHNKKELSEIAGKCLNAILHDYSAFSVTTIDKFFQRTLKSFAREIGRFASYQIELDRDSMIQESVDRVLDSISEENKELLDWLTEGAFNDLSEGKKYSLEKSLSTAAYRLMHFSFTDSIEKYGIDRNEMFTKENIRRIEKLCTDVVEEFANKVRKASCNIINVFNSKGYTENDFRNYFYSGIDKLRNFRSSDKFSPSSTLIKCISGETDLFKKTDKEAPVKRAALEGLLENDFSTLYSLCGDKAIIERQTAMVVLSGLHNMGVGHDLYREFDELIKEKNIISLTESDTILKDIINGSDAPFIYEKLGVRLENFLLDEFQDTSHIQWENLHPLLLESQSHASYNSSEKDEKPYSLIVGDVKQSIYRWRGSDWNLLAEEVPQILKKENVELKDSPLKENYRSSGVIVDFNNNFFPYMAKILDDSLGENETLISDIYSSVAQTCMRDKTSGSVDVTFAEPGCENEVVLEAIKEVCEKGASYGDIAILVRTNNLGSEIAGYLIANGIPVVTNDSLMVRSSSVVRKIVSWLTLMDNPDDILSGFIAGEITPEYPSDSHSIIDECEYFLRKIEQRSPGTLKDHTLYIQSFLDIIKDYVSKNGNNLRGFLEEWKDNKTSISSPTGGKAVNIITIHKSKGLEFPYTIYLYKPSKYETSIKTGERFWCRPDSKNTKLSELSKYMYDVPLSSSSEKTMFHEDYRQEIKKLYVDLINIAYVAFTRPSLGLHIITSKLGGLNTSSILNKFVSDTKNGFTQKVQEGKYERFSKGEIYNFSSLKRNKNRKEDVIFSPFISYAPNPIVQNEAGEEVILSRLKFRSETSDFFSEDGKVGIDASARRRGNIMHKILSLVNSIDELHNAVTESEISGEIDSIHSREIYEFLEKAIKSVQKYGWFSVEAENVRNERAIIDTNGRIYRPDRVVKNNSGEIIIVDYKFGVPETQYKKQLERYANLYYRMGYKNVSAYIWYVGKDCDAVDRVV